MSELDALLDSLMGDDEWSRHRVLERLREEGAEPDLVRALVAPLAGDDAARRAAARMALSALAGPASPTRDQAGGCLVEALHSEDADVRVLAASAAGESHNTKLVPPLLAALDDPDPNAAAAAADALGELGHPAALEPLVRLTEHANHWTLAAALVALGRLGDPRAVPALERAAARPGFEAIVAEAIRRINDPGGLAALRIIQGRAPREALESAGSILSSHPELVPPGWVVAGAQAHEGYLRARLEAADEPSLARLLGIAGTPAAIETLLDLVLPPRRSEAALNGVLAIPPDRRVDPVLDRLDRSDDVEPEDHVVLLSLLPPLIDPERIGRLVPLLSDSRPHVRRAAAEALGRSPGASAVLAEELGRDPLHPEVVRVSGALGPTACAALVPLLRDEDAAIRAASADALGRCADPGLASEIEEVASGEAHPEVRRSLLRALGRVGGGSAVPALAGALQDPDPETRITVIETLGATGSRDAIPHLAAMLGGAPAERLAAIAALGELRHPEALERMEPFLRSPHLEHRRAAAGAVVPMAGAVPLDTLEALSQDEDPWVRTFGARMLRQHGPAGRRALERLASDDPDPAVRDEARRALDRED